MGVSTMKSRRRKNIDPIHAQNGVTLVEMMVAVFLGIIVSAGVLTVFMATAKSSKFQEQLSSIQTVGRFAINKIRHDISMANGGYCSNSGGNATLSSSGVYIDKLRAPKVFAKSGLVASLSDVTTQWGTSGYPSSPIQAFSMPSFLYMRGYDCDVSGSCAPVDPSISTDIPEPGQAVGDRVIGSSVLTVRYTPPDAGWRVTAGGTTVTSGPSGAIEKITISPLPGEPPAASFDTGIAMLADCSTSEIFSVTSSGKPTLANNFALPGAMGGATGVKVFDIDGAYKTVTYYLKVVNGIGDNKTGALIKRVNGVDNVLARGVERLDFKFGVTGPSGGTRFLTAQQVDNGSAMCFSDPTLPLSPGNAKGCLWRFVKSVEVNILVSAKKELHTLTKNELAYVYGPDSATMVPQPPSLHDVRPLIDQGFQKNVSRKWFSALVAIRNYNP